VVDTSIKLSGVISSVTLQWGHHFAVVDTQSFLVRMRVVVQASMGPPLCSGGYLRVELVDHVNTSLASMGPPLCSGGYYHMTDLNVDWYLRLEWGHHFAVVDT